MDGIKALAEAAKTYRVIEYGQVLRALAWELRQSNNNWEFQLLSVMMPDGQKRWFLRNNSSKRWYRNRYDLTREMIDEDRTRKKDRWGCYDPEHRKFGTAVGSSADEEEYKKSHRDGWGHRPEQSS